MFLVPKRLYNLRLAARAVRTIQATVWLCENPFPSCPDYPADEMVYTKARLESALKVFRLTAPYRKRKGTKDTCLNRELRKTTKISRSRSFQSWNYSGTQHDSDDDDDEYCPIEEQRRLNGSRRKKKATGSKRKPSDAGDQQRPTKRKRGDEPLYQIGDPGYVTLKLTSQKGKEKLEELSRGRRTNQEYSRRKVKGRESSDGENGGSSQPRRKRAGRGTTLEDESMDLDDDLSPDDNARVRESVYERLAEPKVEQFKTHYAHPINFKLFPGENGHPHCHFCTDWTMGVVGLRQTIVTATRNPDNPSEYKEIADGHRAAGHPPTAMCVKCSLDRLLIMRCHSPSHQPTHPLPINKLSPPFIKIHAQEVSGPQSYRYLQHLLARLRGDRPDLISGTYPLPSCSLCPLPASWKCSKWQERDRGRRLCKVPEISVQAKEPVVISLLDSSDEDEADESPALRPPLHGCGLHLCATCHTLITRDCDGLLPETKVLDYLSKTRLGKRADAQWLFTGSLLEEAFEGKGKENGKRG